MKSIKQFVSLIMVSVIAFVAIPAWAQSETTPSGGGGGSSVGVLPFDLSVVQSQDRVREYALKSVVKGSRYVSSDSMDWSYSDSVTSVNVTGTSAEDVLDKLFAVEFAYRLTNPDDTVNGWVYLYDKDGGFIFYGNARYTGSSVGAEKPAYNIWMQNIPMLSGVESAEVLALDEDGKTARRYQLGVDVNGRLLFPSWYAGAPNGILAVRFSDGSLVTYNLADGNGQSPDPTKDTVASYKIDGHHVFKDGKVKVLETWVRPTVLLDLSSSQTDGSLVVDVMGLVQDNGQTYFERPTKMVVTLEDGTEGEVDLNADGPTTFDNVDAAKYRFRFVWENFGKPNTLYTGPEYSVGKG